MMVFGQMNEPPGARLRVGLSGLTMAEYYRRHWRPGCAAVHRQHLPFRPGGLRGLGAAGADAVRGRLPADPRNRDDFRSGSSRRRDRSPPCRRSSSPRTTSPIPLRRRCSRTSTPPRCCRDRSRQGIYPAVEPLDSDLDDPQAGDRRPGAATTPPASPGGPAALKASGHHRDPRDRRARRRGQADRQPGAEDPALPLTAVLRRLTVHGPRRRYMSSRSP